jgi:uncharacterized protein YegP (UPF0339 family)
MRLNELWNKLISWLNSFGVSTSKDTVEVCRAANTQWYWHKKAANNEVIAVGETYSNKNAAIGGAFRANPEINRIKVCDVRGKQEEIWVAERSRTGGWHRTV